MKKLKHWILVFLQSNRIISGLFGLVYAVIYVMLGRRGATDHFFSSWSYLIRAIEIKGRPMNITIEPSSYCNLECPVCETGAGILGRANQLMQFNNFKIVVDKVYSHTNTLMLYFMGETFLNKNAYEMIRYAKQKGIPFITTCTNGDVVNPEKLVKSGLDEVSFQIGGMTQETHSVYRIGSNLATVLKNLEDTIKFRDEFGSDLTVSCGFILMKHNEHEVETFNTQMAKIGVDNAVVIGACVRTVEQGREMLPSDTTYWEYDPDAFSNGILIPRKRLPSGCPWIYYSLVVQADGKVTPCCRDPKGTMVMGNLLERELGEIWNGLKFQNFRKKLLENQKDMDICSLCSGYWVSKIS